MRIARPLGAGILAAAAVTLAQGCFEDTTGTGSGESSTSIGTTMGPLGPETSTSTTRSSSSTMGADTSSSSTTNVDESSSGAPVGPPRVVFINFDGVTLTDADSDAPQADQVEWDLLARTWSAFDGNEEAIFAKGEQLFAPYNIRLVPERPQEGEYDMIVVSGDASPLPDNVFILRRASTVDCGDARGPGDIVVVTLGNSGMPNAVHGVILGRAIAYTLGMDLVDGTAAEAMTTGLSADDGSRSFTDDCAPLWGGSAGCSPLTDCPPNSQASSRHLLEVLGPSGP